MEVRLAKNAGYCFGVREAVNTARQKALEYSSVLTLGDLIHNKSVVSELAANGVQTIGSAAEAPQGSVVLIRAHGVPAGELDILRKKCCTVFDATCPFVKKIHSIVEAESAENRPIIIVGKSEHPEVVGIASRCRMFKVAEDEENLRAVLAEWSDFPVSVVAQTTFSKKTFDFFKNLIKNTCKDVRIFDTMCSATELRQSEAAKEASNAEAVIVVGDPKSSNTNNLFAICAAACKNTMFVESAKQLNSRRFDGVKSVFVTAGASTPDDIIKEVCRKMADKIETIGAESFEELLEQSFKTLHTGEKVTGIVTSVGNTDITVDLGVKQSGYIPTTELSYDPSFNVAENIKVGDKIEASVVRVNDVDGVVTLSKRRLDAVKNWDVLEASVDGKETFDGTIVEDNKGGVMALVLGIKVFIPASQTGLPRGSEMATLLKTTHKIRITEVNRARRRVVGSIKQASAEARNAAQAKIWDSIAVGTKYQGVVKSFTSYGAFVDIGGVDGMVHISELSWRRIQHPSEVLQVGQTIEVYVIAFDAEKHKISLGYKNKDENPWGDFIAKYSVGDVVSVKIVKFMPFGAFAEITPNVDGLIHISQIANKHIDKPEDVLKLGDMVDAKIVAIDEEKKKISLSIRALSEPAAAEEPAEESSAKE